jgi:hypothetical protein
MARIACALLLLSVACLARATTVSPTIDKSTTVITLNDANFDEILAQGDWLVDFMSPGAASGSKCVQ